ncbi:MAG: DNA translocase FtsK [Candidatus Omnitrophica bacterium]|nr:DNA translocase FtsK [Candidatus Omnitrophota bacterium]
MPRVAIPPLWAARATGALIATTGLFLTICFLTYSPEDIPWLSFPPAQPPVNLGGRLGAWVGFIGRGGFGWASLAAPLLCVLWAWRAWRSQAPELRWGSMALATLCLMGSFGTLLALTAATDAARAQLGGTVGFLLAGSGSYYLGVLGTVLVAGCVGLLSWLIAAGQTLSSPGAQLLRRAGARMHTLIRRPAAAAAASKAAAEPAAEPAAAAPAGMPPPRVRIRSTIEPKPKTVPTPPRRQSAGGFQLPPLGLLADPPPLSERQISEDLQANARILIDTLQDFGIEARVTNIDRGPSVARYEVMPAPGVKLTKIVSLADDLALVMKAASCHIVAPIPGKGCVGIDVPNSKATVVYLKEIVTSPEFTSSPSPIVLPIGKDVSGQAIVTDLRECPHLLIAGATGSGKTVCLNSVLLGIMMHASPEQVKFLMVDPKMVELAMFNAIPHLVAPVVTNAKKAAVALQWAVGEMERRYQLFARAGTRNIEQYNKRLASGASLPKPEASSEGETADDGPPDDGRPLPYLVVVIDELADLMMIAAQDVEGAIARLAQLSRAVGLHMILATQRPSVDVITGVIKANFPARLAFQVASKVDSRTILDVNGADKLLGRGDLLFLRPGTAKPLRAQGAFVTDAEIERVTTFLKQQRSPTYDEGLLDKARQPEHAMGGGEHDEMYETAKQLVLDTGQASTSFLQRRLRLGYGRAARLLDQMEQEGLVGPAQGSRPREVLVTRDVIRSGASSG